MLLDRFRLQLELDKLQLPEDVSESIDFYMNEFEDCTDEINDLRKRIEELQKKHTEAPKKEIQNQKEITISAKFDGKCKDCGGDTKTGTKVRWVPGISGVRHVEGQCTNSKL